MSNILFTLGYSATPCGIELTQQLTSG